MHTCFHLPNKDTSIFTTNDEKVIQRAPFDRLDWKEMSACEHHAFAIS